MDVVRRQIQVRGIVQGVGFRPFVYRLAQWFHLHGHVRNTGVGVLMEVEGAPQPVAEFLAGVAREHPPLAQIAETVVTELEPTGDTGFAVQPTREEQPQFTLVSPDLATCSDCRREFTDPNDRRYGYPFINCTNCGPRYSIIRDLPYDRPATSMAAFHMCPCCHAEYEDPASRRFHAEPNACAACGPSLTLESPGGLPVTETSAALAEARRMLAVGRILAIKGLGGFQLACEAENDDAVRLLRQHKRRPDKPFAVMVSGLEHAERLCLVAAADRDALLSPARPIVILERRPDAALSEAVAPGNRTLGVMLPYTPLHALLFDGVCPQVLVMTSGNISEEPIVTNNEEARKRLAAVADAFLFHDRDIYARVDDSVARTFEGRPRVLRRARGYAPKPIDLGRDVGQILACGGELKNTFCLTKGRYALVSQHIGNLENHETLEFFRETLDHMKRLFRVEPRVVAHDLHPEYLSSRFARDLSHVERIAVQHHHAHIAACMAENGLRDKVIGVAFDGTGYGTDGKIWGGEFLVADFAGFERRAHLRYVPLAGGDAAVREPWRSALSYLIDTFGVVPELPILQTIAEKEREIVEAMIRRRRNAVETSSSGRLFDAVAATLGLCRKVSFEGQAAIQLETIADAGTTGRYPFDIATTEPCQIDLRPAIQEIVNDIGRGAPAAAVSARFHNTMAAVIAEVCLLLRRSEQINRVCLSGGTFQNMFLLGRSVTALRRHGFEVFLHSKVPPNDGGLSLGQAVVAGRVSS
ncbi:MAG TPA: carbamoyltransferase HypF [Bryobacteraceae bacterium]|nr:carbamoyltransferase HypF [Bryobacteraceae bacterium]